MIGYEDQTLYADQKTIEFALNSSAVEMSELEVLASRAGENTPVAYTNVSKEELSLRLGSRDIPLALNMVPSVYSTGQGGGAGDARINVRGFNQRNVAIMINGIPVNDMENGWVYWSNWDGLADATSSIQMQKGLSAQNLATPSIGGSMNVITDPSSQERRGSFKQEVGAWGFLKTTMSYHSGLMANDKLALSGTLVRKTGEGYYAGTWTDAYAYYFDASYNINNAHRLQFYALGAPQRHGQNLYRQNIAVYETKFAKSLDGL
jgi:Outer membrane receptor for ferrienterochelin and colicins